MPTRAPSKNKAALATATLLAALLAFPFGMVAPTAAHAAASSDEARFLALTNQLRASVGVPPLTLDAGMSNVARGWSQQMAASGGISHNPDRATQITGWSALGENVGMGTNVDIVHQALVNSPPHYENLTDRQFTLVGIGVAYGPNTVYVTEDFVLPAGNRDGPDVDSPPAPEPAPAPVDTSPPPPPSRAPTTTAAPVPPAAPASTVGSHPAVAPALDPVPAELRPIVTELRDWTAVFFPGSDPSIALDRDTSHSGDGGGGH